MAKDSDSELLKRIGSPYLNMPNPLGIRSAFANLIRGRQSDALSRLKASGISQQTIDEFTPRIQRSNLEPGGTIQSQINQLLSGGDNPLRRREQLRLRSEVARERPGLRGLLTG